MRLKGISLKYKLLAALTLIPLIGLSCFLLIAVNIFEKDKIAYIFDSSLSVSKTRAARVGSEVGNVISLSQAVVLSYRADTKNLAEAGQYYFEKEPKLQAFQVHALNPLTGQYEKTVDLNKMPSGAAKANDKFYSELVAGAREKSLVIQHSPDGSQVWMGARFGEVTDPKHVIALTRFDAAEVAQVFADRGPYVSFLLSQNIGDSIFQITEMEEGWAPGAIWADLSKSKIPEGIGELKSPSGRPYLASFTEAGIGDLVVVSLVDREAALQAVNVLLKKSVLFFLAVISATAIIAVIASRGLTSTLARLSSATRQIAEGDYSVRVEENAGGELGTLASSFNAMAEEVSRLMKETAEKARMENELATAKAVQETLFPQSFAQLGGIQIAGHYTPASECGGDWWYYCENGDKVYIWIGDATGHGAPAALLTSAARAVASVINFGPQRPVGEALGILNRAICETSKGKMMMTFFLACIDKKTGEMTYANASHEPPLLLQGGVNDPGRDDFVALNNVNNPRLGEQPDRVFKEESVTLHPGDRVVFYTDGVVDVKNPEEKVFGERRFLKALSAQMTASQLPNESVPAFVDNLWTFRSATPLDDDVTLVMCRYEGAA